MVNKMKIVKITIIGNSVALRTRPIVNYPNQFNYHQLLEKSLPEILPDYSIQVTNLSVGGSNITDIIKRSDTFVSTFPQFFIINLGVVDASTREIPLWFFKIINTKGDGVLKVILSKIYVKFIKPIRPILVRLRRKKSWISKKRYTKLFDQFIYYLLKETNAKIIILPINKSTSRIIKQVPGSFENYKKYNQSMREIADKYKQKFVELNELVPEIHCPDGIHFSSEGHALINKKLERIIIDNIL